MYFCQALVESAVLKCGLGAHQLVKDRVSAPSLDQGAYAACYVDGVAAVADNDPDANNLIERVAVQLEDMGLKCKPVCKAGEDQIFAGLVFDRNTGRISVSASRIWHIRLALLHLVQCGHCSGDDLRQVLGHYNYAGILRRELLSVFHVTYRFIEKSASKV